MEEIMTIEQAIDLPQTADSSQPTPSPSVSNASSRQSSDHTSSTSPPVPTISTNRLPDQDLEDADEVIPMERPTGAVSATAHLRKPRKPLSLDLMFSPHTVDDVLRSTVPQAQMLSPPIEENMTSSSKQIKRSLPFQVQVVEDNSLNKRILTRVMDQCNIAYLLASDGAEAVEQFREHRPALVLLDINMPVMDGYEAALAMRAIEAGDNDGTTRSLIVAVTALSDEYSRRKGLDECRIDQWLTKPLDVGKLRASLKKWKDVYDAGDPLS
ncbi:hypothetical protein L7F22_007076 [Adiantum nelumboides]|nr:hypothetical protein [Adiantum nelumboides]